MVSFQKYNPQEKLVHRINTSEGFDSDNVLAFMKEIRELLEIKNLKSKYPILNLYCNWCVHPELSNSNTIYRILEQITDIFLTESDIGSKFIADVNQLLSMDDLRNQMFEVFKSENIPDHWISINENWHGFRQRLLSNIVLKPIKFPPEIDSDADKLTKGEALSKGAKQRAEIYLRTKKKSRGLGAVSLVLDDRVAGQEQGDVYWEVEISQGRRIRSRLIFSDIKY